MSYKKNPDGSLVLGPDGHPIPELQGIVSAVMTPVQHDRRGGEGGGGASAEGVAIGKLLDCPQCSATPCACDAKKGS